MAGKIVEAHQGANGWKISLLLRTSSSSFINNSREKTMTQAGNIQYFFPMFLMDSQM